MIKEKTFFCCVFLSHNRLPPFHGRPSSARRSKSYTSHMASRCSDNIHSDPLYRKTIRAIHPLEAAGIITAQSYTGRRALTTRYVIVNEHEARKKLLRSATRIPRHFLMEEPAEILELYPSNIKRFTTRTPYHQPHPHRSFPLQPNLSEEEEEEEKQDRRSGPLGPAHRPHSLSDLHQPLHFYIGDHVDSHVSQAKDNHASWGEYRAGKENEEADAGGEMDWEDLEAHSKSQAHVKVADPLLVRPKHHIPSPGRYSQTLSKTRHMETHVKPKTRPKMEPPLTESDSASLASSSDQQNSSTDQYIQVIHNKERYLKSEAKQGKLTKKKTKTNFDLNVSESNDLMCSNV